MRRRRVVLGLAIGAVITGAAVAGILVLRAREGAGRDARPLDIVTRVPGKPSLGVRRMGDIEHGARIFARNCVSCHGLDGRGDGPVAGAAIALARPRDLADPREMNARSDEALHAVIAKGGLETGRSWLMPPFGAELDALDVWDIVAYLRALHPTVADVLPAARTWAAHEVVGARGEREVFFEAFDAAGAPAGFVAFEEVPGARPAAWIAVAEDPRGAPLPARMFGAVAGSDAVAAVERALRERLARARAEERSEIARAERRWNELRTAPELLSRGERLFLEQCASCHGATGQRIGPGVRAIGPLALPARNLADGAFLARRSDAEIARTIREGGLAVGISGDMPAFPLPEEDLRALVEFVRSLSSRASAEATCLCMKSDARCRGATDDRCRCAGAAGSGTCPAMPKERGS